MTDDSFEPFQYNYFYVSSSTFDVSFDDESDKHAREQCILNKSFPLNSYAAVQKSLVVYCTVLHKVHHMSQRHHGELAVVQEVTWEVFTHHVLSGLVMYGIPYEEPTACSWCNSPLWPVSGASAPKWDLCGSYIISVPPSHKQMHTAHLNLYVIGIDGFSSHCTCMLLK